MSPAAATATTAAAHHALMALKVSGTIATVAPDTFAALLQRQEAPLVVHATTRFGKRYHYLTSYRGLAFHTRATHPLELPAGSELVLAEKLWIP